ncbi:MAG: trypsin-like peptidase domain-containing protein [Cytophagales bacterium]|nr:trypsin-like peptidase domain-containing protein [Armatimonadota bacterium]
MALTETAVHDDRGGLGAFSEGLAEAVARAAASVVRVDDGARLTASGTIWSEEGVIVATSHGVERDEELVVVLADGSRHAASLVGRDGDTDIAVLRVDGAAGLPAISRADAASVRVGQVALALGHPGDMGLLATIGIVSSRRDSQTEGHDEYILSTDADLYPGISGGPLVNAEGALLGLLNRMYGRGLGVALGTPLVARVVATLLAHGRIPRGYLGIRTQLVAVPANLKTSLQLAHERGLLVVNVEAESPAEQGGLMLGDTLLSIGGEAVEDVNTLRRHLHAGQTIPVQILRGGTLINVTPTVGSEPA